MPADYIPALVAHRASRIVWSGAGHVLQRGTSGFQYCLSEKAEFIEEEYGEETTQNRPLVNSRDEPLSDSDLYRRIHDVAGESVFSPRVMALQLASEALILKACGLGEKFDDLKPVWGPHAIQTISRDPSLNAVVELDGGLRCTGVQLQHEIASRAISAVERAKLMTPQDKVYKTIWLAILDDLEHGRFTDKNGKHQFDWVPKRRRIDAGLRSATRKHSDYVTAAMMSREYHQILPREGTGMKLVRAGGFVDAPKKEVLEQGPGLPPTRGGLRGQAIGRLEHKRVPYIVNWDHLKVDDGANGSQPTVILKDPFAAEDGRVEKVLRSVAA